MVQNPQKTIPEQEQLSDILLVLDRKKMKIEAVSGVDKKGNLKTVDPAKKNQNQFMRVDKSGDLFSNFFSNFISQLNNPTRFSFFKVDKNDAEQKAKQLQNLTNKPSNENKKELSALEIPQPENQTPLNNRIMEVNQNEQTNKELRYQPEQLDWETLSNMGLSQERLEKQNLLEPLLKGYKTNELVSINVNLGSVITKLDARLSLQPGEDGKATVAIHGIRREPQLNYPFFGHQFTEEDKQNLLNTGNMGRTVNLQNLKTGDLIPSIISIDRLTNELIALKSQYIKVPDEIKGVTLDDVQKQILSEGKPLHLEAMISAKGEPFDATLQYNADKRYVEFLFDRNASPILANTNEQKVSPQENQISEVPKTFRGQELNQQQMEKLNAGQSVYLKGLVDRSGKEYQGYITYDKASGQTQFSFNDPKSAVNQKENQGAAQKNGSTKPVEKAVKTKIENSQDGPQQKAGGVKRKM